ncbi:MAG: threonine--tRNA ligase [Candidatus Micrarchaeota archaeon]
MRLLQLHCDYMQYKPERKAMKSGYEELSAEDMRQHRYENVLAVFASVEHGDTAQTAAKAAEAVRKNFGEVKASTVLLYPYAHLSSNLAKPADAVNVLNALLVEIRTFTPSAEKSPFGWYKSFELKCKGHPLSELSKTISEEQLQNLEAPEIREVQEEAVSESLKQESETHSEFFIISPGAAAAAPDKFDFSAHPGLKAFADYEVRKVRAYAKEPPHIRIMKEHALANYEPASDSGQFRWLPKGLLVKKLIERHVTDLLVEYGAMQVETPIMYDYAHPALSKYLNRFPARQYTVKSDDKNFFLRFAACFGQFLAVHDMTISYKDLPLKIYELTHYSFRREQSGELAGLKRLRAFSMPDMHTLCSDIGMAKLEFERQFELCRRWNEDLGIPVELAFRVQKDFFEENRQWYYSMLERTGKPALLEVFDRRYAYFVTKFEMNFVDGAGKAAGMSTVQIDVENGETFDLNYTDASGKKMHPLILHASIPGAVERVIYALLEREAMLSEKGKPPTLPLWLSPTQVRLVPVSDKHLPHCKTLLASPELSGVRADVDDRAETLPKKVRDAEREWVPFIAVVGDKEVQSGELSVRVRAEGRQETMPAQKLGQVLRGECSGKPFEPLSLSPFLSKRPVF